MASHGQKLTNAPLGGHQPPTTSGLTVIGWITLCFAVIPLSMAVHGEGYATTVVAAAMVAAGVVLIAMGRLTRRRPGSGPGATAAPH